MKKLLIAFSMLLAASAAYATDYEAVKINVLNPTSIKYYDTDLCRWWSWARFPNGTTGLVCNSVGRAQVADAFSVSQELEALKKRVEELEKPVEDK